MTSRCPCQVCSEKIEFETERFQPGMTTTCPHCGMETVLFIPAGTPRQGAHDESNEYIFKSGTVALTSSLLTAGLSTFPVSAISSFRIAVIPPSHKIITYLSTFALIGLFFGILFEIGGADSDSIGVRVLGWALICLAAIAFTVFIFARVIPEFGYKLTGKPSFSLNITTSGGEKAIIISQDIVELDAIGDALRKAISKRG